MEENTTRKPYKFIKCWFLNDSCKELISANWNMQDRGSHAFRLTRSLINVKDILRNWNLNTSGNIQTQLKLVQHELALVNTNNADRNFPSKIEFGSKIKYWYDVQKEFYIQRAEENILSYDDRNTRDSIASELKRHFSNICRSRTPPSPVKLLVNIESCISDEDNDVLLSTPSADDIRKIVFQMQPWTSPGPDGYQPGFYQEMWDVVGEDTVKVVQAFFHSKHLFKQMNHSIISLIPKSSCPKHASDFRSISLSNVSYKIISILLASRIKKVMDKFISPYQAAFLSSRQITDNIVIAHELVSSIRNVKLKRKALWLSS
ncbi:uncharacterized protein LOC113324862 [Papaver somniferum]|uniref:uncharacterized protein LOC113324862 n=1 Tax=Papaver somniferum TaxID=3469 RepID=UPI000E7059C7|nr:uncharacterized protein LOC113324862 [Papaver somniferum]